MKILISGGCGYIGSVLCHLLSRKKINYAVIDNLTNSSVKNLPKNSNFYYGSIQNINVLKRFPKSSIPHTLFI